MKSKILDLLFFIGILFVILHFSIGLDELGPLGWAIVGAIVVVWFVVEVVFDFGFDILGRWIGFSSGKGPLKVTAVEQGDDLLLTATNEGKNNMSVAVILGVTDSGKEVVPTHYKPSVRGSKREKFGTFEQLSAFKLSSGSSAQVVLDKRELSSLGCKSLVARDTSTNDWPVEWQMA